MNGRTKIAVNYRVSEETIILHDALVTKLGLSKTAVHELAIKRLAQREKIAIRGRS